MLQRWGLVLCGVWIAATIWGCSTEGDGDDPCAVDGRYGDGTCDRDCPHPDQDCGGEGYCDHNADDDYCRNQGSQGDQQPWLTVEALGADKLRLARGETTSIFIGTSQGGTSVTVPDMEFHVLSGDGTIHVDSEIVSFTAGQTLGPVRIELIASLPEGVSDTAFLDLEVINLPPQIESFQWVPQLSTVVSGQTLELQVQASDPEDGAALQYAFQILGGDGQLTGDDSATGKRFTAGSSGGEVELGVTVSDREGESASASLWFNVDGSPAPVVALLGDTDDAVVGDEVQLEVQLVEGDEGSGPVDFAFEIIAGQATLGGNDSAFGKTVTPSAAGSVTVRVVVTEVDSGRTTSADFTLGVVNNSAPTGSPCVFGFDPAVDTSVSWALVCGATDGNDDALSANVTQDGDFGSFSVDGDQLIYTPGVDFEGSDSGQLTVSDTRGGSVVLQINTSVRYWQWVGNGGARGLGLKTDGTLWGWGNNTFGRLGMGFSSVSYGRPVQVGTDTDWAQLAVGYHHVLALKEDGTLWAFGSNEHGQVGVPTNGDHQMAPVQVGSDSDWSSIHVGKYHSFAIKPNGDLWGWGRNDTSQLCNGGTTNVTAPTLLGSGWRSMVGGELSSAGIKTNGTLWACGDNQLGKLGQGTESIYGVDIHIDHDSDEPVQIGVLDDWEQVVAGEDHFLALRDRGMNGASLYAWGKDFSGQIGDGGDDHARTAPVLIGTDYDKVAAGIDHSLGIKADGSLWTWGYNVYGQLGLDTRTVLAPDPADPTGTRFIVTDDQDRHAPVQVSPGSNTWQFISGGGMRSSALRSDSSLWNWGRNDGNVLGLGNDTPYIEVPTAL